MKRNELLILHFRDTNKYPPILNLINFLQSTSTSFSLVRGTNSFSKLANAITYFVFFTKSFFALLEKKNKTVLYYESISAVPVYFYFKLFPNSKKKIFIHFHEYFSLSDYQRQSYLERVGRKLEVNLFKRAKWISHTNKHRLDLFHKEFPNLSNFVLKTLPNYPPSSWLRAPKQMNEAQKTDIIKLVHIGALSINGMYLEYVLKHFGNNPKFTIDFYSHNFTPEITALISNYSNCSIKGSIAYQDIPTLKGLYDLGLVLYNGSSLNFTYNAPNKIFEYLALDLDVWCSDKLITAGEHQRLECYPKMIMVNYENLEVFDVAKATDKSGLEYVPSPYVCEPVYEKLLNAINENTHP